MPSPQKPTCMFVETPEIQILHFRQLRFQLESIFGDIKIEAFKRKTRPPQTDLLIMPETTRYPSPKKLGMWMHATQAKIAVMLRFVHSSAPRSENQRVMYIENPLDQGVQDTLVERIRNWVPSVTSD